MLSLSPALLAVAVSCWPVRTATLRLRALTPAGASVRRLCRVPAPGVSIAVALFGCLGWWVFGPATAAATVLTAVTAHRRLRSRGEYRTQLDATTGMAQALRALVAELRAGAHPAAAAEGAATECTRQAAEAMTAISAAARLGGDIEPALRRCAVATPALSPVLDQLARAWAMVTRYGLPLAEVLDAVRRDLEHRVRFASQVRARMAGPRSAALVLTLLPAVGVLLGELMGAHPLGVLGFTGAGQALLLLGVGLSCAGVAWSARLTDRTVLR
ncbi:MAG: type II secretion system F family protein [Sciscionella sp.]